jgi:hypothetical protein
MARAAMEDCLREKLARSFGRKAVAQKGLEYLIEELAPRLKLLSPEGRKLAHKVQEVAGKVLHNRAAALREPPAVIEDARKVILELSGR